LGVATDRWRGLKRVDLPTYWRAGSEQVDVAPRGGGTSEGTPDPPPGMVLHVRGGVRPPPRDDAACPWGGQTPPPG
jgi:hypothetical protein